MRYILSIILIFVFINCYAADGNLIIFYDPFSDTPNEENLIKKEEDYNLQYENVKNSDPKIDFEKAISNNDLKFIVISGYSYLIPGIKEGQNNEQVKKFGFKVIAGTSDAIDPDYPPLQIIAYDYAEKYNTILLLYLTDIEKK